MSFMQIEIDCTENPELKAKLDADGGALLKKFAEKAQDLVSQMCSETPSQAYEKACKEDSVMKAILRGEHDPSGKELLGRATNEELQNVFKVGYMAGHAAGKKRKRVEDTVVSELNKQLCGPAISMEPVDKEATARPPKEVVLSDLAAKTIDAQAAKKPKTAEQEEEERAYRNAVATPEDADMPYRNAVASIDDNGDEEPKYQSLSA